MQQQYRSARSRPAMLFDVSEQHRAPDSQEVFSVSPNIARRLSFLCETWNGEEQLAPSLGFSRLKEDCESVRITQGSNTYVPDLKSTQQEAGTRIIIHTVYSVPSEDVERVIVLVDEIYPVIHAWLVGRCG